MKMTESVIQKSIMDYLELFSRTNNIYYFRAGSGKIITETGRHFKTGRPGLTDIVVCYDGKFIGLEIKTKKGRQSQPQKDAEQKINDAGGSYHIIRSLSDVKKILPPERLSKKSIR